MALYRIHYRSQASGQLTNSDVEELINKAKTNNHGKNITGAILLVDDYFMQVIEGEEEEVKKLFYKKIIHDRRHSRVRVILEGQIHERSFSSWDMGLHIFNEEQGNSKEETFYLKSELESKNDLAFNILKYFYRTGEVELNNFWKSY